MCFFSTSIEMIILMDEFISSPSRQNADRQTSNFTLFMCKTVADFIFLFGKSKCFTSDES